MHRAHGTGAFLILTLFAGALTAALVGLGYRKHFTGALGLGAILLSVACGELGPLWGGRVGALCMGRPVVLSTVPLCGHRPPHIPCSIGMSRRSE